MIDVTHDNQCVTDRLTHTVIGTSNETLHMWWERDAKPHKPKNLKYSGVDSDVTSKRKRARVQQVRVAA